MATLQDFSLLDTKVKNALRENEFPNIGYAFGYVFLQEFMQDVDDVEEYITDGSGDLGIDAFYIDEESKTVHIFQFKYTEDFDKHKQASIRQDDLDKLHTRIDQILNRNVAILGIANPEMERFVRQYWELVSKDRFEIKVYFVTNLEDPITDKVKKVYTKSMGSFNIEIDFFDIKKVIETILSSKAKKKNIKIQVSGKSYFEKTDGEIKCLVGSVNVLKLFDSLLEDGILNEDVFDENVRMYLKGKSGSINEEIKVTAQKDDNYKFFYFNNGITIVCEDINYTPSSDSPVVDIISFQIVNGSQTIHSLYEIYKDPNARIKLSNVYLLMRIYQVKDRKLGQDVARFTNSQNPVKGRDIRSNDSTQVKLQEQLAERGYSYSRKKNEFIDDRTIDKNKIIDAEKVGQTILAFYLEKPGDAKNKKSEIYRKEYNSIFDEEKLTAEYVLLPLMLYSEIDERVKLLKKEKRTIVKNKDDKKLEEFIIKKDFMLHASYYILFTLSVLAKSGKIKISYENFTKIKKMITKAEKLIEDVLKEHKNELPSKLFKNNQIALEIKDRLNVI